MKKTNYFTLLLLLVSTFTMFAQVANKAKRKIACVTTSCCSFGVFEIEIVSTKHCFYVYTENAKGTSLNQIEFESDTKLNTLTLENDIIFPQFLDFENNPIILKKGKHELVNNSIDVDAVDTNAKFVIKKACVDEHVTGHVLGHDVDYTITICAYYLTWQKNGSIKITPMLSEDQKSDLLKNDNEIEFEKDRVIKSGDFSYTLKAGKYTVNDDGSIYLLNVELK
jgi:hypothetical protein